MDEYLPPIRPEQHRSAYLSHLEQARLALITRREAYFRAKEYQLCDSALTALRELECLIRVARGELEAAP